MVGGDEKNRLYVFWVIGEKPPVGSRARGFRHTSSVVVGSSVAELWRHGVDVRYGAPGVILTSVVPPEALVSVWAVPQRAQRCSRCCWQRTGRGGELRAVKPDGGPKAESSDEV